MNHPMHGMHYAILLEAYLGGCGEAMLVYIHIYEWYIAIYIYTKLKCLI